LRNIEDDGEGSNLWTLSLRRGERGVTGAKAEGTEKKKDDFSRKEKIYLLFTKEEKGQPHARIF